MNDSHHEAVPLSYSNTVEISNTESQHNNMPEGSPCRSVTPLPPNPEKDYAREGTRLAPPKDNHVTVFLSPERAEYDPEVMCDGEKRTLE